MPHTNTEHIPYDYILSLYQWPRMIYILLLKHSAITERVQMAEKAGDNKYSFRTFMALTPIVCEKYLFYNFHIQKKMYHNFARARL